MKNKTIMDLIFCCEAMKILLQALIAGVIGGHGACRAELLLGKGDEAQGAKPRTSLYE